MILQRLWGLLTRLLRKEKIPEDTAIAKSALAVSSQIKLDSTMWFAFSYIQVTCLYNNIEDAFINLYQLRAKLITKEPIDRVYTAKCDIIDYMTKNDGTLADTEYIIEYLTLVQEVANLIPEESLPHEEVGFNTLSKELKYQMECFKVMYAI
jgi:hypothetical protein